MEHFFFPEFKWTPALRCAPESNYWGNADVDHTQTIGRDTVKLLGGIDLPHPLGFWHTCIPVQNTISEVLKTLYFPYSAFWSAGQ